MKASGVALSNRATNHPLVEPRIVAAVGLAALGGGLGIGLMLARILIVWGLVMSLGAAIGILWIYLAHFKRAYVALTTRKRYRGASGKELVASIVIVFVIFTTSIAVFLVEKNEIGPDHARLLFKSVSVVQYPNESAKQFNIEIDNTGTLPAVRGVSASSGFVYAANGALTQPAEQAEMEKLRQRIKAIDVAKLSDAQIGVGQGIIITLPDLFVSDDDLRDIEGARKVLYVFFVTNYEDYDSTAGGYWAYEFCGYFIVKWNYWHNCYIPSRTYRITSAR